MKKLPVRDRLINTASELFYQKGYNRTGINEILEKAGVAKASMYQHFRSKEEMCVEYLRHMDQQLMKDLSAKVESVPEGPDRVMAVIDFVHEFFFQKNFRGCWSLNTIAEMPHDDLLVNTEIQNQKKRFKAWLQKLVADNLKANRPEEVANHLYLLYEVALMESHLFRAEWPILTAKGMFEKIIKENS